MRLHLPLLAVIGLGTLLACEPTRPGALVWGNSDATVYADAGDVSAVHVGPAVGAKTDPDVEAALTRSLGRRGIAVDAAALRRLRYRLQTVPANAEDDGLGVLLGGTFGSSGSDDVGVGLDLPIFGGGGEVRQTSFRLELSLEAEDGTLLWRGRANGQARTSEPKKIMRPLAALLLGRLGRNSASRSFTR